MLQPRNAARISEKRKAYLDACSETNSQNFQQRYHAEEVEERFGRFKPGVIRYLCHFSGECHFDFISIWNVLCIQRVMVGVIPRAVVSV